MKQDTFKPIGLILNVEELEQLITTLDEIYNEPLTYKALNKITSLKEAIFAKMNEPYEIKIEREVRDTNETTRLLSPTTRWYIKR